MSKNKEFAARLRAIADLAERLPFRANAYIHFFGCTDFELAKSILVDEEFRSVSLSDCETYQGNTVDNVSVTLLGPVKSQVTA